MVMGYAIPAFRGTILRCEEETWTMTDFLRGEQGVPDEGTRPEVPESREEQRSLAGVLLGDVNTVSVTVASSVAAAYAVKRILGGGPGDKDAGNGDDSGPAAGAAG